MSYDKLVAALRCKNDGKLPCDNKECPYWVDQWHGIGLCNILKKHTDAADAIEALQAEYEREKRRAYIYAELFDIMRKSRNEIIEQIGRVKGVPDFALHYPEYNLCANYPEKPDSSESPNG